jgi:isoquinoline 1-oxidoreductase beta subunit
MSRRSSGPSAVSRRDFLHASATGGLVFAFSLAGRFSRRETGAAAALAPNAYLRIGDDGAVTLWCTRSEMGQGVRTTLPMILADELEVEWRRVTVAQASMTPAFAGIRLRTSGSGSSAGTWTPLRTAAATAREMLRAAAAAEWRVALDECRCERGAVVHATSGRRAEYGTLVSRAATVPVPKAPPLKPAAAFTLVGTRVGRIDGPAIVTGRATYGLDVRLPGQRFAAVARAPRLGSRAVRWDPTAARAVPGVVDVVPVASGIATGVAVVATSTHAALAGRDALQVTWSDGPHRDFDSETFYRRLDDALSRPGLDARRDGDAAAGMAQAVRRIEGRYLAPFQAHACLEPMNCTADVRTDGCEIWAPTQAPEVAQELAATMLGLPASAVRVHVPLLGGGFGRRLFCDYVPEAVEISRAIKAPVQVVWSRSDDLVHGFFQPAEAHRVEAGLDADGRIVAWTHAVACSDLSMYGPPSTDPKRFAEGGSPWGAYDTPYNVRDLRIEAMPVDSPVPSGPWRAVEYPGSVFARECLIDEVARTVGRDPLAYRLDLLQPFDVVHVGDQRIDRQRLRRVLEVVAERAAWGATPAPQPGRRSGRGLACNVYHAGTHLAQVVDVSVGADGDIRVHRVVVAVDCGQPLNVVGVEGQVESGVMWGLAAALHTATSFAGGRAQETSFAGFPIPRISDAPRIETHIVRGDDRPHGLGEQAVAPVAAAVFNAVFDATGQRIRRMGRRV